MGGGDFGSDGSVHWNVKYSDNPADPPDHLDYDDTKKHPDKPGTDPRPPIGDGKAGKGLFRVTIRCKNAAEAAKLLSDATARNQLAGSSDVVIDFPIKPYKPKPPNPKNRNEWEISVDW
jgi:hypothetical protein